HATIERREKARVSGEPVHPEFHSSATASPGRSIKSAARPRRRHVPHWLVGLGSAASLVLVAGLAWHMRTTSMQEPAQADRATAAPEAAVSLPPIRQVDDTTNAKPVEDVANPARGQLTLGDTLGSVAAPTVSEGAASSAPAKIPSRLRSAERASNKARDERSSAPAAQIAPPPVAPSPASPLQEISTRPIAAAAPARAAPPSAAIAAKTSVSTAVDASDTPEQELDKIQRLFMHGHADEARQRLRDFRQAHPDWPLPPALRAQQTEP
ncbi:MAG: hypothetical protein ABI128_07260, partial [Rhodanobacter sp.]